MEPSVQTKPVDAAHLDAVLTAGAVGRLAAVGAASGGAVPVVRLAVVPVGVVGGSAIGPDEADVVVSRIVAVAGAADLGEDVVEANVRAAAGDDLDGLRDVPADIPQVRVGRETR